MKREAPATAWVLAQDENGALHTLRAALDPADWTREAPIIPAEAPAAFDSTQEAVTWAPDPVRRGAGVYGASFKDSGGLEVVLREASGARVRLTHAAGDDYGAAYSPDGRYIAFFTDREADSSASDIASSSESMSGRSASARNSAASL